MTKAAAACPSESRFNSSKPKNNGPSTKPFFTHCCGRSSLASDFIDCEVGFGSAGRRGEKTIGDPERKSHDRRLWIDARGARQDAAIGDQDVVGLAQPAARIGGKRSEERRVGKECS